VTLFETRKRSLSYSHSIVAGGVKLISLADLLHVCTRLDGLVHLQYMATAVAQLVHFWLDVLAGVVQSTAALELTIQCVDLGGRRIIKKKNDHFCKHWIVARNSPMHFYAATALVVDNYKVSEANASGLFPKKRVKVILFFSLLSLALPIGIFCILDNKPWNQGLITKQKQLLEHLAATTTCILIDR